MSTIGHNSGFAAQQLVAFAERVERLSEEIEGLQDDRKEVFEEAKGVGFDPAILKKALKLRAMPKAEREEAAAILDLYVRALEEGDKAQFEKSLKEGV
jgi:uncharacterized protein (UPF0335 family)